MSNGFSIEVAGCPRADHCSPEMSIYATVRMEAHTGLHHAAPARLHHMLCSQVTAVETAQLAMSSPLLHTVNLCSCYAAGRAVVEPAHWPQAGCCTTLAMSRPLHLTKRHASLAQCRHTCCAGSKTQSGCGLSLFSP